MHKTNANILGRTEVVDLPEWKFEGLEAKIDTGAYTSSLHCHHVEAFNKENAEWIRFNLLDPSHEYYNNQILEMPLLAQREVKSSNGMSELRYFVKTKIRIFDKELPIELSLSDRSAMKFPLLLGRKFLMRQKFIVDVSKTNLSKGQKQTKL